MDEEGDLLDRIKSSMRRNLLAVIMGAVGLALFGFGVVQYFAPQRSPSIEFDAGRQVLAEATLSAVIKVDISGHVVSAGVYKLPADARIEDALRAARGLLETADTVYVSRNLNLAQKLRDGSKVYIPGLAEPKPQSSSAVSLQSNSSSVSDGQNREKIHINSASFEELDSLPGVGKVTADKITSGRPYDDISQLVIKKIVSQSVYDKIKDLIDL